MKTIQRVIKAIDTKQLQHVWLGFPYAVIKKYGQDQTGYQAALLTYYGFLSIFPLLLVLTTILGFMTHSSNGAGGTIIRSLTNYFPMIGSQLSAHVHSLHRNGLALFTGIIFTFYGARGVADAFRQGINHIWHIPFNDRDGFPKSAAKSLTIIIVAGLGFAAASLAAGYAGTVGHGILFRLFSLLINVIILFWIFRFIIALSLPRKLRHQETYVGAITAAIGLVILQSLGSYLLARELKNLDALYSTFALALGLLFWLYLQAQVFYYSVEISVVHSQHLWPRALDAKRPTTADARALHDRNIG